MSTLLQDLRYAWRMLRKSPSFTAIAVITLALGIGANTAIFSVVDAVMLRPLPYPQPDRLMFVTEMALQRDGTLIEGPTSYPDFFDWRTGNHVFEAMASYHSDDFTLIGSGDPIHVTGETVSSEFFSVLRVPPMLGRGFWAEEEKPGTRVVVLSHDLWQSAFAGDRNVVGRKITLNRQSYEVVGVMPAGFTFLFDDQLPKLWRTFSPDAEAGTQGESSTTAERGSHSLRVVARLKSGVTAGQAREEMNRIAQALAKQYPDTNTRHAATAVVPELEHLVGNHRLALWVLLLFVGCVLLIACVNVANLLLVRASKRSREIAVRAALGAARIRVVRQLLTESLLLGLGSALISIPLASWAIRLFANLNAQALPRMRYAIVDGRVLAFTAVIAIATSLVFGLVPAWRASHPNLVQFLKDGGRGNVGGSHQRLRGLLVIAETAIGLVLLVTAGLLLRSFHRLMQVDPGFNAGNVLTFTFDLPDAKYNENQVVQFYDRLLPQLKNLPGVTSASAAYPLPLSNGRLFLTFQIEGHRVSKANAPFAGLRIASPGYFHTLGIPIISGRDFSEGDQTKSPLVVIVNQAFAQRFFPDRDALGKRITTGIVNADKDRPREIVGIVGNVKHQSLTSEFAPEYYLPYPQVAGAGMSICLKTAGRPQSQTSAIQKTLAGMDPDVPIYDVRTMEDYVSSALGQPRFQAVLLQAFALLALVLTAVGLYGVVAYSAVQRTQEIGIRMTLGATADSVLRMILKEGIKLAAIGGAIGVAGSLIITRWIRSLLFDVRPLDALTFVSVIAILGLVSLMASYIPARRATKVDPMAALRQE
ncbi:MAG TPA: ABC transporter permease [Candidatus Angelobacter sp.]|jgi:putative ABC transport system permease protein|nr:ABC transporter permease [Candidatus Angelobacter sp.]